jgi:hypothetical protein
MDHGFPSLQASPGNLAAPDPGHPETGHGFPPFHDAKAHFSTESEKNGFSRQLTPGPASQCVWDREPNGAVGYGHVQ